MTFWVVRAGKYGENETYAIDNNVIVVGWSEIDDLSTITSREELLDRVRDTYPNETIGTIRIWTGELWAFKERMQIGDWVAIPLKSRAAIAMGRIVGPYQHVPEGPEGATHQRRVEWARTDLARSEVDQDLLYSLGSTLAVFSIRRNNAEARFAALAQGSADLPAVSVETPTLNDGEDGSIDLEQFAADQIVNFIKPKFRGHDLARLVGNVLVAEGYKVQVSKPGADGGVDIIAGSGPMGFGHPRLVVQVKSGDAPADVGVLRELQGVMPRFGADQGLLVSWSGFKESVVKEARQLYFQIRLWDAGDLVAAIQQNYERLPEELQAELPLKRVWMLVEE